MSANADGKADNSGARERRIVIIEDESKTVEGMVVALEKRTIRADVAVNAADALQKLANYAYAVVILDVMLPIDSQDSVDTQEKPYDVSVDLLRRIRRGEFAENGTAADVPVIIFTSITESSVMDEIRRENPVCIYPKPQDVVVLAERVKLLLLKDGKM